MKALSFDDLLTSYFEAKEFEKAVDGLRNYFLLKRKILADLFDCPAELTWAWAQSIRDAQSLDEFNTAMTIIRCVGQHSAISSPFPQYMEGKPGPKELALRNRHMQFFDAARQQFQDEYRAVLGSAVEQLYPGRKQLQFPAEALAEGGLTMKRPYPEDFW